MFVLAETQGPGPGVGERFPLPERMIGQDDGLLQRQVHGIAREERPAIRPDDAVSLGSGAAHVEAGTAQDRTGGIVGSTREGTQHTGDNGLRESQTRSADLRDLGELARWWNLARWTKGHDFVGTKTGEEFAQSSQRQEEGRETLLHGGREFDAEGEVEVRGGEAHGLWSRRLHLHTTEDGERRGAGDEFAEAGQRRLQVGGAHGGGRVFSDHVRVRSSGIEVLRC